MLLFPFSLQCHSAEEMGMIPRIAQLEDEIEKKDRVITKLKKNNLTLKVKYFKV